MILLSFVRITSVLLLLLPHIHLERSLPFSRKNHRIRQFAVLREKRIRDKCDCGVVGHAFETATCESQNYGVVIQVLSAFCLPPLSAAYHYEVTQRVFFYYHSKTHAETGFLICGLWRYYSDFTSHVLAHGRLDTKRSTLRKTEATSSGLYEFVSRSVI